MNDPAIGTPGCPHEGQLKKTNGLFICGCGQILLNAARSKPTKRSIGYFDTKCPRCGQELKPEDEKSVANHDNSHGIRIECPKCGLSETFPN